MRRKQPRSGEFEAALAQCVPLFTLPERPQFAHAAAAIVFPPGARAPILCAGGSSGPQVRKRYPRGLNGSLGSRLWPGSWSRTYGAHLQLQAHEDQTFDGVSGARPLILFSGPALNQTTALPDLKAALRKRALLAARASAAAYGEEAGLRVAKAFLASIPISPGATISGYAPLKSEIDPMPLLTRLAARGHQVALPFVDGIDRPLRLKRWRPGDPLLAGQFGARQPAGDADDLNPDILIVPLVAFDTRGYRLGRGGGFYDRTIAELKARGTVLTVGVGFAAQNILEIPREAHDQRLDWVVTEEGALHCIPAG